MIDRWIPGGTNALVALVAVATTSAPAIAGLAPSVVNGDAGTSVDAPTFDADRVVERNLELTAELAALEPASSGGADAVSQWQADVLGLSWTEPVPLEGYEQPSSALAELADRRGAELSAEDRAELAALEDELHPEVRQALASWVDAFLALDTASELAFADADTAALATIGRAALDPADVLEPADPGTAPPGGIAGAHELTQVGVDLAPILSTRVQFLDVTQALEDALADHHEPASHDDCSPTQDEAGTYSLALEACDNHYEDPYQLSLDVGGDDVYHNNAGGNNLEGGCPTFDPTAPVPSPEVEAFGPPAALVDVDGDDTYGDASDRGACGVNGGGVAGAGFLRDVAGDDVYHAANLGTNGGAFLAGVGFLQDLEGNDFYTATEAGANGGGYYGVGHIQDQAGDDEYRVTVYAANGGGGRGLGSLWDLQGNDLYAPAHDLAGRVGQGGIHGAATVDGVGFLLDETGDDTYLGESGGVNGGGRMAVGHLADLAGDDTYEATHTGVNGAASQYYIGTVEPRGLLYDAEGSDTYQDHHIPDGGCQDCTVYPKDTQNGAQIDADDPPDPTDVPPPEPPAR